MFQEVSQIVLAIFCQLIARTEFKIDLIHMQVYYFSSLDIVVWALLKKMYISFQLLWLMSKKEAIDGLKKQKKSLTNDSSS